MKLLASCVLAFALVSPVHAGVIVVSGSGFVLNDAVQAAADGDTVLVHAGSYFFFDVNAKSLSILAYPGETVSVTASNPPSARIRNLPAGKTCVVSGIRAFQLEIVDCSGSVRIAGMSAVSPSPECFGRIEHSSDVSLTACTFRGKVNPGAIPGGPGLDVLDSNVALCDASASGGPGISLPDTFGVVFGTGGGDGMRVAGTSSVFASNAAFVGANGGNGSAPNPTCHPGGPGGNGIVTAATTTVRLLATTASGGTGGFGCSTQAANGSPVVGSVTNLPGTRRSLEAPAPRREGTTYSMTFRGEPGDRAILVTSARTRWSFEPTMSGVVLYGPGVRRFAMGTLDGSGTLTVNLTAPTLPAGVDSMLQHMQGVLVDVNGAARLSGPITQAYFDSIF